MKKHKSTLKEYMPARVRQNLGADPTYHFNCGIASEGSYGKDGRGKPIRVSRPGKTARDKAKHG